MPLSDETKKRLYARRAEILVRMAESDVDFDSTLRAHLKTLVIRTMPATMHMILFRFLDQLESDFPDVRIYSIRLRDDGKLHVDFKLKPAGWTLERHREVDQWIEAMKAECHDAGGYAHDAS